MGFKIAQHDLEIRGAGNILGSSQSGRINEIGYELYMNLLKEQVDKMKNKGDHKGVYRDVEISLNIQSKIPGEYIDNESTRLKIYRDLFKLEEEAAVVDMEVTIADQYGSLPEAVKQLFLIARIKLVALDLGVRQIVRKSHVIISFNNLSELLIAKIISLVEREASLELTADFKLLAYVDNQKDDIIKLEYIYRILSSLGEGG